MVHADYDGGRPRRRPRRRRARALIAGGGFEAGDFAPAWQHGAFRGSSTTPNLADHAVVLDLPFAGRYSALLGFKYTPQTRNAYGWMGQTITLPSNPSTAVLNFKFRMQGYDSSPYDPFRVRIRDAGGGTLATVVDYSFTEWNDRFKDSGWLDDDNEGNVDDAYRLTATAPPPAS